MNVSPFGKLEVENTSEVRRIAALPRRVWTDDAAAKLADMLTREFRRPGGTMVLRPVQAIALYEAMQTGGLFGPMRVGSGKTVVSILVAKVLEAKHPILLVPAALVPKTWDDYKILAEHWYLPTNVQIISYEMLGLVQSAQKLDYIKPDLIIADEVHMLKSRKAGRTRRVLRYMKDHPETRFVGMSGTIMKASLRDFSHVLKWALKHNAPIPATEDELGTWADALDEKVNPMARRKPGGLFKLGPLPATHAGAIDAARRIFQGRLLETSGVVASSKTDGVTCSLRVSALEYKLSATTEEHVTRLRSLWETPCGKAFSEATEMRMYLRELALGFSYTWVPREKVGEWDALVRTHQKGQQPTNVGVKRTENILSFTSNVADTSLSASQPRSIGCESAGTTSPLANMLRLLRGPAAIAKSVASDLPGRKQYTSITTTPPNVSEASSVTSAIEPWDLSEIALGLSEPLRTFLEQNRAPDWWLNARRTWCSFVREQILRSQKYDTMLQVANACRAGVLDSSVLDAWQAVENKYQPLTRPIFYDVAALEACLGWMRENCGIVWVEHQAFGAALSRLASAPYFGPGGLDASGASIKNERANRPVIASVDACKQGFNLQAFSSNLITSCPPGALTMEQLIGRSHRDGQEADTVVVDVLLGCREHHDAFHRALDGARAAEATLGHSQKLLLADLCFPNIDKDHRTGPLWAW